MLCCLRLKSQEEAGQQESCGKVIVMSSSHRDVASTGGRDEAAQKRYDVENVEVGLYA